MTKPKGRAGAQRFGTRAKRQANPPARRKVCCICGEGFMLPREPPEYGASFCSPECAQEDADNREALERATRAEVQRTDRKAFEASTKFPEPETTACIVCRKMSSWAKFGPRLCSTRCAQVWCRKPHQIAARSYATQAELNNPAKQHADDLDAMAFGDLVAEAHQAAGRLAANTAKVEQQVLALSILLLQRAHADRQNPKG